MSKICILYLKQGSGSVTFSPANPDLLDLDPPVNALEIKILKRRIYQQRFRKKDWGIMETY